MLKKFQNALVFFNNNGNSKKTTKDKNLENLKVVMSKLISANDEEIKANITPCIIADACNSFPSKTNLKKQYKKSDSKKTGEEIINKQLQSTDKLKVRKLHGENELSINPSKSGQPKVLNSTKSPKKPGKIPVPKISNQPSSSEYFIVNKINKLRLSLENSKKNYNEIKSENDLERAIEIEILHSIKDSADRSSIVKVDENLTFKAKDAATISGMRPIKMIIDQSSKMKMVGPMIPIKHFGLLSDKEETFGFPAIMDDVLNQIIKNELKDTIHISTIKWKNEILTISSTLKECSVSNLDYGLWKNSSLSTLSSDSSDLELNETKSTIVELSYTKIQIRRTLEQKDRSWSGNFCTPYIQHADFSFDGGYGYVDGIINFHWLKKRKFSMKPEAQKSRESFMALSHMFSYRKLLSGKVDIPTNKYNNKFIPKKPKYRSRLFSESIEKSLAAKSSASLESFDENLARQFTETNDN